MRRRAEPHVNLQVVDFKVMSGGASVGTPDAMSCVPPAKTPATTDKGKTMQDLTYARYLEDPTVRTAIDDDVIRQRHEAVETFIVQPVRRAIQGLRACIRAPLSARPWGLRPGASAPIATRR